MPSLLQQDPTTIESALEVPLSAQEPRDEPSLDLAERMIPTLERRAGIMPFERNPFGVRPVRFGSLIVDRARLILAQIAIAGCALKEIRTVFGEMGTEA